MGEQVSKQATIVGMLWNGEAPDARALKENMTTYFNLLQGFLLLSHGSMVGAGPTLSSSVLASAKQVVDCSFKLMHGSVSLYEGTYVDNRKPSMPQLAGAVWEACSALKKAPATNITAIGRAITQVAVSVKDVLREMKELKPASLQHTDAACESSSAEAERVPFDEDNSSDSDFLDVSLSPEEMEVAKLAINIVSETLIVIKELIRTITGLVKLENRDENSKFVDSLEKLLKLCRGIEVQMEELGASLYPPQEVTGMKETLEKVASHVNEIQEEVESFKSPSEAFVQACNSLRSSLKQMESGLGCFDAADLAVKMQNVDVRN
ncbi:uncharacterized protein LOC110813440 isoform X2 [Carica papaya]|nr:uncharacterized protein LOC110813440 isoform X2 [Carica papaya]